MPLLPPEPVVYPSDLFGTDATKVNYPAWAECRWWVLHTRPRTEKTLARRLASREVSYFLPQRMREWLSGGRRFSSQLPLFPGYLFLFGGDRERQAALETNLIVNCLHVPDQVQLQGDLHRVFRLIAADATLTPEERLQPGDPVQITQGALTGLQGRVIRRGKNLKFIVEVHFLQQGVSVEVERWMIEPLREDTAQTVKS
jgi:hypothetical protein